MRPSASCGMFASRNTVRGEVDPDSSSAGTAAFRARSTANTAARAAAVIDAVTAVEAVAMVSRGARMSDANCARTSPRLPQDTPLVLGVSLDVPVRLITGKGHKKLWLHGLHPCRACMVFMMCQTRRREGVRRRALVVEDEAPKVR